MADEIDEHLQQWFRRMLDEKIATEPVVAFVARNFREELLAAGYRIELDTSALLTKGVDAVRGGSVR